MKKLRRIDFFKLPRLLSFKVVFGSFLLSCLNPSFAEDIANKESEKEQLEQVDALVDNNQVEEAVEALETMIDEFPESGASRTKLGAIYCLRLGRRKEGIGYAKEAWELGEVKALSLLALVWLLEGDEKSIINHSQDFLDNFEKLASSKFVGFYIAAARNDKVLFLDLLDRVSADEIKKDDMMARMIARAAKVVL